MKPLIRWEPLAPEVIQALEQLEATQTFDALPESYDVVQAEAKRRSFHEAVVMVPLLLLSWALIATLQAFGWIAPPTPLNAFIYILVVPLAAVATNRLRGSYAAREEQRLRAALNKWRMQAGVYAVRRHP